MISKEKPKNICGREINNIPCPLSIKNSETEVDLQFIHLWDGKCIECIGSLESDTFQTINEEKMKKSCDGCICDPPGYAECSQVEVTLVIDRINIPMPYNDLIISCSEIQEKTLELDISEPPEDLFCSLFDIGSQRNVLIIKKNDKDATILQLTQNFKKWLEEGFVEEL